MSRYAHDSTIPSQPPAREERFTLGHELELLISAALIFALLQLPGFLDQIWTTYGDRFGGGLFMTAFILYYVAKLLGYGLGAAVSIHLLCRGFWVAIVGLRHIHPGPLDHARLDFGPLARTFHRRRAARLADIERRADVIATAIFAYIYLYILTLLIALTWALVAWLATIVISLFAPAVPKGPLFYGLFLVFVLPQVIVQLADRRLKQGKKLGRRARRAVRRLQRLTWYQSFGFLTAPLVATLASRTSRKAISIVSVVFVYATLLVFAISTLVSTGLLSVDSFVYHPARARDYTVAAMHYESLRPAGETASVPAIESETVSGPYLRLFIPYDAHEDNERIERLCPGLEPMRREGLSLRPKRDADRSHTEAVLDCLARVWIVELDDDPIDPEFLFHTHPAGDMPGRLAMIPVDDLARGRHTLVVRHQPIAGEPQERPDRYVIPFWR